MTQVKRDNIEVGQQPGKCTFCALIGHTWTNCITRQNTPYCTKCGVYGHELGPLCEKSKPAQQDRTINVCNHCQKRGHTEAECFEKLFCKICKIKGHWANHFCSAKFQNARAVPFEGNLSPNGQQNNPRNFQNNRRNRSGSSPSRENRAQTSLAQLKCYNCDQQGHIARQCPLKNQENQGNFSRPSQGR